MLQARATPRYETSLLALDRYRPGKAFGLGIYRRRVPTLYTYILVLMPGKWAADAFSWSDLIDTRQVC